MEIYAETAMSILDELHTERLDYHSEYLPLADAINRLESYEETGLEPEDMKRVFNEDAILKLAGQALGMSPDRLRELAQAAKDGRLLVLTDVKYTDSDGDKALRHAMYMCGVQNNPVTRYTADAIAEKLTREAAEAALEEREAEHESNV